MKRALLNLWATLSTSALLVTTQAWAQDPPAEEKPAEGGDTAAPETPPPAEGAEGEKKEETAPPPPTTPPPAQPTAEPGTATAAPTAPAAQPAPAGTGFSFGASTSAQADQGGAPGAGPGAAEKKEKLPWRGTSFGWDHSVTTETLGVGQEIQTRNPTYEMSFVLQPRYYLWEEEEAEQSISLRARLDLIREFTNSDSTTNQGEWTFSDFSIFPQYSRTLAKDGDMSTSFGARVPTLQFPTSKVSANNGRILSAGAQVFVGQQVPLMGTESDVLQTASATLRLGYKHWFTQATQPTNSDLERVRLGPDGRSAPGDQLGGAAFAEHEASVDVLADIAIAEKVSLGLLFSWRPSWKYEFDSSKPVCNVLTGCETPQQVNDPNNFSVVTWFNPEVSVDPIDELNVAVGYANVTLQVGPDGKRRNMFYSPDARVYATLTANIDKIYQSATKQSAKAPAQTSVAKR
ncbi:MAG: hypothetical protein R3B13_23360 [Polyangiaceae bacterium]